ncbi:MULTISPECIES: ATP-binding cassette domain-containing protein [Borreliella]|uniref:ATP-binding cassette domain-containing protein n=1 Tax=Borreliella TaxID=64895 RepID=UPI001AF00325|nr:ABC transporter ATP-binding protein [Borreliella valaisiana]
MKLSVNTINKSYKIFKEIVHANKDISFGLKSKDMVWLSGPTGSGKTTLIDLISGIDIIDSGEIVLDCFVLSSMKDKQRTLFRKCNMGLIFQHFELIPSFTGFENILLPLKFSGKNWKNKEKVDSLVELFNLENFIKKRPSYMSGGQKQGIGIARAFVYNPKLIIGDEVISHLDRVIANFIYFVVKNYIEKNDAIGLFVSHDSSLEEFANRFFQNRRW